MVGCGAMGGALLELWQPHYQVTIIDPFKEKCLKSIGDLPLGYEPELVLIAIKPQVLSEVLPDYARFKNTLFISIAAGVQLERYGTWLGNIRLVRIMSNLAVQVSAAASAYMLNENCTVTDERLVLSLFAKAGLVHKVNDESWFDTITALSGSGLAYVYHLCECLGNAAQELGLNEHLAAIFARQTIIGAAAMLKTLPDSPAQLRKNVTSNGGTTEAALNVLGRDGAMQTLFAKALAAARDRSQELAKC